MTDRHEHEFREFAAARMDRLRSLAYLTCGDWHLAEDAVSTALARLYVRWSRIDDPESYARRVVINAAIDEKRRPWRRERSAGDGIPDTAGPDPAEALDERSYLLTALRRIPPGQRAVVVLRFYEGLSVEQVAQVLGRSTGTVKSQAARGLVALRAVLADERDPSPDSLSWQHPSTPWREPLEGANRRW